MNKSYRVVSDLKGVYVVDKKGQKIASCLSEKRAQEIIDELKNKNNKIKNIIDQDQKQK